MINREVGLVKRRDDYTFKTAVPLDLPEIRQHLNVIAADEVTDDQLRSIALAATQKIETDLHRTLKDAVFNLYLQRFPRGKIDIEFPPLLEVLVIIYKNAAGETVLLDDSTYEVNTIAEPGYIVPIHNAVFPQTKSTINAVEIFFRAGYGSLNTDVPAPIRHAIKLIISELYSNREETVTGSIVIDVPVNARNLIAPYVVPYF